MERLSGLDASFLYLESRSQLMHIIGLIELDPNTVEGGYSFEKMRDELQRRIAGLPTFRRKLRDSILNIDHPVWVEDRNFDIESHVHRVAVPSPGGRTELADFCAHIAGVPLDRSKPLWEMWVIEGLADGKIAVLLRMHHAGVDGVTASDLLAKLCTFSPETPELDEESLSHSAGDASLAGLAVDGALQVARRPLSFARLLPKTAQVPFDWIARALRNEAMPLPFRAPRTPFNGSITGHRSMAYTQVSLADIKRIKNQFGVKINDVVLSVCAGALRGYLDELGELPDKPLVAMVPVSVHGDNDDDLVTQGTNKVTGMFTKLATDIEDPVQRITTVGEQVRKSKEHHGSMDSNLFRGWAQFVPPATMGVAMRLYASQDLAEKHPVLYNLVISNVAGPDFPLYYLGAKIEAMYPLGPVFHGAGMNITVFSQDGQLNIGVIACKEHVPDPWPLMQAFEDEVKTLLEACD
ncbi:UNVERIFIED_CONTAM: WS/DGAT/MGAT family acyltransferase [Williamsia faeni]